MRMNVNEAVEVVNVTVSETSPVSFAIDTEIQGSYPDYTGPLEVIPNTRTQILPTAGTGLLENIIIDPIPSNYGLITWNGATLTVS